MGWTYLSGNGKFQVVSTASKLVAPSDASYPTGTGTSEEWAEIHLLPVHLSDTNG